MYIPNFLQIPVYAFELSDRSYKYLRLKEKNKHVVLADFGEGELASGIIEKGEIKKSESLKALIKELCGKKNIRYAAISLPEEKGFSINIELKNLRRDEIRSALELQLEERVPLPPADVVFDYSIVSEDANRFNVALSAFPVSVASSYADVFYNAGALPVLVESELQASVRSLVPKNMPETAMIIDWGKTRTSFAISENGILRFASTVPVGGDALDQAISKVMNVDIKAAEDLKIKHGFSQSPESAAVFQAIVPVVTALCEEAEKYMSFWQTHSEKKEPPKHIFLSGGDANLTGLMDYLEQDLGTPVRIGNPWINIDIPPYYIPPIRKEDAVRFSASLGLALKSLTSVKIF